MDELDSSDRARYYFEHRLLRDYFYGTDTGEDMVVALLKGGSSFLWEVVSNWCEETGNEIWGTKEQYRVFICKCGKGYSMIRIDMPKPQKELLCYQIYLVFDGDFRRRAYFTVERGASQRVRFLCSWKLRECAIHYNYGQCSANVSKTERRIANIFTNRKDKPFWMQREVWWCALAATFIGVVALYAERKECQNMQNSTKYLKNI